MIKLTRKKLMKCPACGEPGIRVYDTGDLVYTVDESGKMEIEDFEADEGVGWIVYCRKCGASDERYCPLISNVDWKSMTVMLGRRK